uniref:calmodulin-binding receptor-like cytoplasmic kinase 3 n=1 Tax=Erigeron canadensis TaxID=72917 RepID=UPI001CB8E549|nr:calmodulin-binding receptor-like cytoplasmic kinase 3 [Erigeron canadensis]
MEDGQSVLYLIKSGNIGLDKNWRAKIVSFIGCSVLLSKNEDDNEDAIGKMEAEFAETHFKLTRASNIDSFGTVLLEALSGMVVSGSRFLNKGAFPSFAPLSFREGTELMEIIDPILKGGPNKESLEKVFKLTHECRAKTPNQRPTIEVVIQELQEALFLQGVKDVDI